MFSRPTRYSSDTLRHAIAKAEALLVHDNEGHEKIKAWLNNYKSALESLEFSLTWSSSQIIPNKYLW